MPIDDIVFIEVMATPAIGGELPEMYELHQKDGAVHRPEDYGKQTMKGAVSYELYDLRKTQG